MNSTKLFELANNSGGTLYLMSFLLLVALTVIIDRTRHLLNMQHAGEELMALLRKDGHLKSNEAHALMSKNTDLPHARIVLSIAEEENHLYINTGLMKLKNCLCMIVSIIDCLHYN